MSPSPIRCRGPWKIHKRSSEPDRWLDEMGFFRKHTARDSSCLFRAVSENIYNTQRYFHKVRLDCVQFMASKRHLFEGVGLNDHCLNFCYSFQSKHSLISSFYVVVFDLPIRKLSQRDVKSVRMGRAYWNICHEPSLLVRLPLITWNNQLASVICTHILNVSLHITGAILLYLRLTKGPRLKYAMATVTQYSCFTPLKPSTLMRFTLKTSLIHLRFVSVSYILNCR